MKKFENIYNLYCKSVVVLLVVLLIGQLVCLGRAYSDLKKATDAYTSSLIRKEAFTLNE